MVNATTDLPDKTTKGGMLYVLRYPGTNLLAAASLAALLSIAAVSARSASSCPRRPMRLRRCRFRTNRSAGRSDHADAARRATPPYENNAYNLSEGKRLYQWFNCVGCHAHGGGDSGPPLMDNQWRYGGEIEQIYATIQQGTAQRHARFRRQDP